LSTPLTGPPGKPLGGTITNERTYDLPADRDTVWKLINEVGSYRSWWTWLRIFEAQGMLVGDDWRCEVQPPLPYPVRFRLIIDEVSAPSFVRAHIEGDVIGTATLDLKQGEPGHCTVVLASALAPGNATLRLVSRLAAPVARFGHDWVLDSGARQFIARGIGPIADGTANGTPDGTIA
jgi:hypothetical protein